MDKDQALSFRCLQKSIQLSLPDYQPPPGVQTTPTLRLVAQHELSQAIYELAISFKEGWGIPPSPESALYYMTIAGRLGDRDAQQELGEWYMRGYAVERRDKREAAHWYRLAAKQGAHMVCMDWIWKDKYN